MLDFRLALVVKKHSLCVAILLHQPVIFLRPFINPVSYYLIAFGRVRGQIAAIGRLRHSNVLQIFDYDSAAIHMDETLVTNHQYQEFLNHNLTEIRAERGVVRAEDQIWLLLGKIKEWGLKVSDVTSRDKIREATGLN